MIIFNFTVVFMNKITGKKEIEDFNSIAADYFRAWGEATEWACDKLKSELSKDWYIQSIYSYLS